MELRGISLRKTRCSERTVGSFLDELSRGEARITITTEIDRIVDAMVGERRGGSP
jgi:hypothetical protein